MTLKMKNNHLLKCLLATCVIGAMSQLTYANIVKGNIPRGKILTDGAGQGVPTMRIGNKKPSVWNHFDLRLWRH